MLRNEESHVSLVPSVAIEDTCVTTTGAPWLGLGGMAMDLRISLSLGQPHEGESVDDAEPFNDLTFVGTLATRAALTLLKSYLFS